MQTILIRLLAVFIVSSILRIIVHMIFGVGFIGTAGSILIDLGVLGCIYVLLKEYRYINLRKTMYFLGGMTFISILMDLHVIRGDIGQLIILGIIAWMIFGRDGLWNRGRYR